jgi:acetylornithine/succinyldiaminopimelate/putrescine aminotransferase
MAYHAPHFGAGQSDQNVAGHCIDEVQTGFCRTGTLFACEQFDLVPDMLCLAKGIAGGMPMGAVLCTDRVQATVVLWSIK